MSVDVDAHILQAVIFMKSGILDVSRILGTFESMSVFAAGCFSCRIDVTVASEPPYSLLQLLYMRLKSLAFLTVSKNDGKTFHTSIVYNLF